MVDRWIRCLVVGLLLLQPVMARAKDEQRAEVDRKGQELNFDLEDGEEEDQLELAEEEGEEAEDGVVAGPSITTPYYPGVAAQSGKKSKKFDKVPMTFIVVGASIVALIGGILAVHSDMGVDYPQS